MWRGRKKNRREIEPGEKRWLSIDTGSPCRVVERLALSLKGLWVLCRGESGYNIGILQ